MVLREKAEKFAYWVCWAVGSALLKTFFKLEVKGEENIKDLKGPLIIALNHCSFLDWLFLDVAISPNYPITPIHYAAWHTYYWRFLPVMFIAGTFPIKRGIGLANSLEKGLEILNHGGTVGIFPEGKRHHFGRPRRGRRGVAFLALQTNAKILPVYISGSIGLKFSDLLRKRKIVITLGEPFSLVLHSFEQTLEENTRLESFSNFVMQKVYQLKNAK